MKKDGWEKAMDFFGMIPDNFFSLLASKNKRIYLASIIQSFKTYETGSILGIEKKIVVDDLVNYLDNSSYLYDIEDEEDEDAEDWESPVKKWESFEKTILSEEEPHARFCKGIVR